jgi:hypothetical protein
MKGVSWLMEVQKVWGIFVLTSKKRILSSKIWILDWEFLETGEKYHPSST